MLQVGEAGFIDFHLLKLRPRLLLGQSHRTQLGLAEDAGGNVAVVNPPRLAVVEIARQSRPLGRRHRRQVHPVGDIAYGVNGRGGALPLLIDQDGALVVETDVRRFQPQALGVGPAPRGVQDQVRLQGAARSQIGCQPAVLLLDLVH